MPWFKVDDGLSTKLETTRIPRAHRTAALGLWALAGSWSARELTDGHIPAHMIEELAGTLEDAQRLVEAGFWLVVDGGFQFAVWEGEQPMRAKVIEQREKNAAKVQNWRARNRVTNRDTNRDVTLPPTRPDPTRPSSDEEKDSPPPPAPDVLPDFERAYEHWPKKVERKKSLQAFVRAARSRGVEQLTSDVVRFGDAYAATTEPQFVPALCVWINGERWTDDLPTLKPPTQAEWDAVLASAKPSAPVASLDPCAGGHRWMPDGTCNLCPARREAGAA